MPGMSLWKRSVSWSGNFDCLSDLSSLTNKAIFDFLRHSSRMCGVAV